MTKEEMALKAKEIIIHIRKVLVFSMRIIYRTCRKHPFVWGMVFFLLILYRYLPSLFGFVVSTSPVMVCTALLLGTLLLYADANLPETVEEQNVGGSQNVGTGYSYIFSEDENLADTYVASKATPLGEVEGLKAKCVQRCRYVSSLESPWQPSDDHDASSGSESDDAESSSPDASVSDIIPILDELHPLLDSDAPLIELRSVDNSDADSCATPQDRESDDGSIEEEIENQEDEEDEAQEEKDDANEVVLKWTADDQKNLMDLGTSEVERNQRLENLIAKRRARKFLSFHAEKNLIDLDSDDPVPSEDISRFNYQISSISAPRRNPFDIPFEEEPMGLPPIPGSAPSILQPRQNPFDVPFDQGKENTSLSRVTMHQREFVPPPQRDIFFQRPETLGVASGDIKLGAQDSILKPYFVAERKDLEGPGFVPFQSESSEKGDLKMSSANESDTTSSDMDREDHMELVAPEVPESHLLSLANHYAQPVEGDSQSSEDVDSVDVPHEQIGVDEGINMFLNASTVAEETHQTADAFGAVEMELRQGEYTSPDLDAGKLEVIQERYDDSSSSSSEAYENHSKMSHESGNPVGRDNSSKYPDTSMQSFSVDSNLRRATEWVEDDQVADPVYDSSPSAAEKSLFNSSEEDALVIEGKEGFTSGNHLISGEMDSAEEGTARKPHGSKVSSEERPLGSDSGGIWVASSSLSFVDENESRSREINVIREGDVIQIGLPAINEDFSHPMSPKLPKFVLPSRLFVSSNDNGFEGDAKINNGKSSSLSITGKPPTPRDVSPISKPLLINTADLPTIPEEHSEHLPMDDEHESTIGQALFSSGLTGMQLVEEPKEGFAEDIHQALDKEGGVDGGSSVEQSDKSSLVKEDEASSSSAMGKIRNMTKFW